MKVPLMTSFCFLRERYGDFVRNMDKKDMVTFLGGVSK